MNVLIVLAAVSTLCLADPKIASAIEEEIIKELLNDYKQKHDDSIEPFCVDTGLKCHRCAECHDNLQFGLCITGAAASKCLCNWGWTGPHAQRVIAPNDVSAYSRNRIRADDCKTPCHYTHDFWWVISYILLYFWCKCCNLVFQVLSSVIQKHVTQRSVSDCNGIQTHNNLVRKPTLKR